MWSEPRFAQKSKTHVELNNHRSRFAPKQGEMWGGLRFAWKIKTYYYIKQLKQIFVSIHINSTCMHVRITHTNTRTHTELIMKRWYRQKVLKIFTNVLKFFHFLHLIFDFGNVPRVLKKNFLQKTQNLDKPLF